MDTRKVQRLGPSTLAMTLPAQWARTHDVEKGDEVTLRTGDSGMLLVTTESLTDDDSTAIIAADTLPAAAVERAIVGQYVLGRRIIRIVNKDDVLDSETINAVYRAEDQLMGLGVIEETPESISIRCSVDAEDFTLDNLLERLESTGHTMRNEAIDALAHGDSDLAQRALNRERQANKIFVLVLRLIISAHQNPNLAPPIGLTSGFPLLGYRSIAKNLELIADNAQDIAEIVLETPEHTLSVDQPIVARIQEFTSEVDELSTLAIQATIDRDFEQTTAARQRSQRLQDREQEILSDLPELDNATLLRIREVLVSLQETAQYAMQNAEIAANLALNQESEAVTITSVSDS